MNIVHVEASRSYDVLIGSGLLRSIGSHTAELGSVQKAVIVSDTNVFPLYGQQVRSSLLDAGIATAEFVFPAGEESKNGTVYLRLLNFLAENGLTRYDCLIALGGGVVGDLTGFAAATYLRGIPFIQIPTSLLAMVDSSVGGKTAIDLPAGKNLCGAFWQPSLVLCDPQLLSTLPSDYFQDGCAEVIKYGVLYDSALFSHLEHAGLYFDREEVITRCVQLKRDVVARDEFDTGERMKLNLGHTVGHGIERCSNFSLSHGRAVAIGMAIVCRASKCPDTARIIACLQAFGLPVTIHYPADAIFRYSLSDKKRSGGSVSLIIPQSIGHCAIVPTHVDRLKTFIEEGL